MRQRLSAIISWWRERRNREPTVLAYGIWDRLSHLGDLDEPAYVCAFASELGFRLWKDHEQTPDITPARFVECAEQLLAEERAEGAGYILALPPYLRKEVTGALPLLAVFVGGNRFGRRVEQLLPNDPPRHEQEDIE